MIALARHIESLLLKHDCVIVPDFGGFVTQQVAARYVEDEGLFLPPYRSVGFNG
ncbi:MAG: SPOR domain-containing protein, partial [Bacteroidaceae bacterium]|nr:SPOR domain-containing protein [Bacteroidaceae bacterium]